MLNWTHVMAHEEQLREVRRQVAREHLAERAHPTERPRGRNLTAWILYVVLMGLHAVTRVPRA